jgi:hypothetical protein
VGPRSSVPNRSAPPSLIFDHKTDSAPVLWQRLHERWRSGAALRLVVHLKRGMTYVGKLVHFDLTRLTIAARDTQHYECWVHNLSYVLVVATDSAASPLAPT